MNPTQEALFTNPTPQDPAPPDPAPPDTDPLELDDEQRAAVEHGDGPLMIVAGAGTGKTTVIARRIAHLIKSKRARPSQILALAYNEKAAAEMQERVDLLVPYGYADVTICTFHAFGNDVLAAHGVEIGISPGFNVLDKTAQCLFIAERLGELPLDRYVPLSDPTQYLRNIADYVTRAKDEPLWPDDLRRIAEEYTRSDDEAVRDQGRGDLELAEVYEAYNKMLWGAGFIDFGDQLALTYRLFEASPAALRHFQERYRYVLVDEFQDTNHVQFKIVRKLVERHRNLVVVGDDDQSIYAFRGAHLRNILEFRDHYPDAKEIVLRRNYRSTRQILDVSRRLIRFNQQRLEKRSGIVKELITEKEGQEPRCREFATEAEEASAVADEIARGLAAGRERRDYAILVRQNRFAEPFLRALEQAGIEYWFSGSRGLFQRPEVKQLIALLQSLHQGTRPEHLYLLASEGYDVPEADLSKLVHLMKDHPGSFRMLLDLAVNGVVDARISEEGRERIGAMLEDLLELERYSRGKRTGEVLYHHLERRGILRALASSRSYQDEGRARNLVKFFQIIRSFEKVALSDRVPLFLRHLEAIQEHGEDPSVADMDVSSNVVQVMTIHKAKGLEFPVVFVVQAAMRRFPSGYRPRAFELPADDAASAFVDPGERHKEEERRLCYVAMTRAKDELIATCARNYGTSQEFLRSQFLSEAFDLGKPLPAQTRRRAVELLEEHKERETISAADALGLDPKIPLALSFRRLDDYDSCPLRYRLMHVVGVDTILPPDPRINFGQAMHTAVAFALARRMAGAPPTVDEMIEIFRSGWQSAGYLSPDIEKERFAQGAEALRAFHAREIAAGPVPSAVESPFRVGMGNVVLTGRMDRVDEGGDGKKTTLVDYKTAETDGDDKSKQREKNEQQLMVYALAYRELNGRLPDQVEVRYILSGAIERVPVSGSMLQKARTKIDLVAAAIRSGDFSAKPNTFACRKCRCRPICPESAV
ncbi:MAG TPA: ATP-dependent DNA helicase [Candidatus Eisenbacteria bacterium]|nr:ATP-dependent DNA helicase [Candidatus Eisenbacteria bacterium]